MTDIQTLHCLLARAPHLKTQLSGAKRAFSTRNVDLSQASCLRDDLRPQAGDLVLATIKHVGQHKRIERPDGRRAHLYAGDQVIVCYGRRYAPDQFEAEVPEDLQPCKLVAAGGVAGKVVSRHKNMATATQLKPLGLICDEQGRPLNVSDFALKGLAAARPPVIAVTGTSMNAGKTTSAARLIRGLTRAGLRVGAAKITGTGAGGDYWSMLDAGAARVLDFTDAGFATTAGVPVSELVKVMEVLTSQLAADGHDVLVIEVADGLLQEDTAALLAHPLFHQTIDGMIFAAADALGAVHGGQRLQDAGFNLLALSGSFTAAPLAVREVQACVETPVLQKTELSNAEVAMALLDQAVGVQCEPACAP